MLFKCLRLPEFSVQHWQVQHSSYRRETWVFLEWQRILSPTMVLAWCQLESAEFQQSVLCTPVSCLSF